MCVLHSIYTCISQHIALVYFVYMIRNDTATCSTCAVATFIDLYWKCQWTSSVKIWENILQYGNNKYNNFLIFFINKLNLKELSILFLTEGKSILMFHVNNIQFGQELKILLGHFWASKMLIMWPFTKYIQIQKYVIIDWGLLFVVLLKFRTINNEYHVFIYCRKINSLAIYRKT